MPANISINNGRAEMFYAGATPWHGLGTGLTGLATSAEAIEAAGLNWKVEKRPLFYSSVAEAEGRTISTATNRASNLFATVRADNNRMLGVVSEDFHILQNREAFSWFDAIVGEKATMYETAGALRGGARIFILANLNGVVRVIGDDVIKKYVCLAHGHDGSLAVWILRTGIRVVCQNTLTQALNEARGRLSRAEGGAIRFLHFANLGTRLDEVRNALGIINVQFEVMAEAARKLAAVQLTQDAVSNYFKSVVVPPADLAEVAAGKRKFGPRTVSLLEDLDRLFVEGKGSELPGVHGTAWGAFNSVVESVDFRRKSASGPNTTEAEFRTDDILFGTGSNIKQKAWDRALALVA